MTRDAPITRYTHNNNGRFTKRLWPISYGQYRCVADGFCLWPIWSSVWPIWLVADIDVIRSSIVHSPHGTYLYSLMVPRLLTDMPLTVTPICQHNQIADKRSSRKPSWQHVKLSNNQPAYRSTRRLTNSPKSQNQR